MKFSVCFKGLISPVVLIFVSVRINCPNIDKGLLSLLRRRGKTHICSTGLFIVRCLVSVCQRFVRFHLAVSYVGVCRLNTLSNCLRGYVFSILQLFSHCLSNATSSKIPTSVAFEDVVQRPCGNSSFTTFLRAGYAFYRMCV